MPDRNVSCGSILLKKSTIERLRKSREGRILVVSAAASLWSAGAETSDCLCRNLCGPSRRRARDAPAVLKNFVWRPESLFQQYRPERDVAAKRGNSNASVRARRPPAKAAFNPARRLSD